jgi:hypothetical protein
MVHAVVPSARNKPIQHQRFLVPPPDPRICSIQRSSNTKFAPQPPPPHPPTTDLYISTHMFISFFGSQPANCPPGPPRHSLGPRRPNPPSPCLRWPALRPLRRREISSPAPPTTLPPNPRAGSDRRHNLRFCHRLRLRAQAPETLPLKQPGGGLRIRRPVRPPPRPAPRPSRRDRDLSLLDPRRIGRF